jgi:low affinity Fe/Cu permease
MFDTLARRVEHAAGSPWTFFLAVVVVVVWAATGPIFEWSDTWQLVINTGTTIVTFLMVFLVQATQSRDTLALHTKLDELIRVGSGRNAGLGSTILTSPLGTADSGVQRKSLLGQ